MVYRTKRAKKRVMKRKRNIGKRRSGRSNTRPDGTYSEKLTYETELYVQGNQATFACHWARTKPSAGTEQFPMGSTTGNAQFKQCAGMFRSYKITGMKLQYRPYFYSAGTADIVIKAITCGTKMDINAAQAVPVPLYDFRASLDAKTYNPQRGFSRFYHISKWASGKEINWRNTAEALTDTYGDATPDCMTCFEVDTIGLNDGFLMGSVLVTYYVKFKGRTNDK